MQDYPIAKPYIQNFEQMAFGMFVHLGLFSQLGAGEWTYTIHKRNMGEYETLIDTFKVESLQDIVATAKSAGCRYLCLTTRHHEGFSLYDTKGLSNRGALGAEEIDAVTYERGMPSPIDRRGHKKYVAGEMCETLCDHWGAANDINFKPVKQLIEELCECRKVGANFLLNIGPNADGSVPTMQKGIMECIGKQTSIFGRAIYNGRPYRTYEGRREFLLRDAKSPKTAYLFAFDLKQSSGDKNVSLDSDSNAFLPLLEIDKEVESICWMDSGEKPAFRQQGDGLILAPEGFAYGTNLCVRVAEITFK